MGENKDNTIIDDTYIRLNVSEVMISSFTIQNNSHIQAISSNNITITDNIFNNYLGNSFLGISMFYSNNNIITDNTFFNCGLSLWGYYNYVYNNSVNGKPLVYIEGKSNSVIDDAGQVILVDCANVTIKNLEISNIGFAIQIFESTNCFILDNELSRNSIGMLLINSTVNKIIGNIFLNNWIGFLLIFAEYNNISGNHFENDIFNVGVENSNNNLFSKNNFIFNLTYLYIRKSIFSIDSDNKWIGNYWNKARLLPVLIWGIKIIRLFIYRNIPSLDIDWHPAKGPYDIGV
jgi:parallel beta-helix repeat protein